MPQYVASCHCGRIRFTVTGEIGQAAECNCSICATSGFLHWFVEPSQVQLGDALEHAQTYVWGSGAARHFFCGHCGVAPLRRPRLAPERLSVNLRCVKGVDVDALIRTARRFDGASLSFEADAGSPT